jgi:hypothetical protein
MIYLKFRLSAQPKRPDQSATTEAVAIVSVDSDNVEQSRNEAATYLKSRRWLIGAMEIAKRIRSLDEVRYDGRLMNLYLQAEQQGFGCLLLAPRVACEKLENLAPRL